MIPNALPTPDDLIAATAAAYSLHPDLLRGPRRTKLVALARQVAAFVLYRVFYGQMSQTQIGTLLGGRDNSTISHAIALVRCRLQEDPNLRDLVNELICLGHGEPIHVTAIQPIPLALVMVPPASPERLAA